MITAAVLITAAGTLLGVGAGGDGERVGTADRRGLRGVGIDNSATSRIHQIAPQHVTFLKGTVAGTVNLLLAVAVTGLGTVTMWSLMVPWPSGRWAMGRRSRCGCAAPTCWALLAVR